MLIHELYKGYNPYCVGVKSLVKIGVESAPIPLAISPDDTYHIVAFAGTLRGICRFIFSKFISPFSLIFSQKTLFIIIFDDLFRDENKYT